MYTQICEKRIKETKFENPKWITGPAREFAATRDARALPRQRGPNPSGAARIHARPALGLLPARAMAELAAGGSAGETETTVMHTE
jgi:hypothetical protein